VRIPNRICSCLDWFGIQYDRTEAIDVLNSYYLFIGIIDNALDTVSIEIGAKVLNQLRYPYSISIDSPESIITENLKVRIEPEIFWLFLLKMEILYAVVCREQNCLNANDYIRERELVGELTAEVSYLLLTPNFGKGLPEVRKFMMRVGEVGCLVDSFLDLRKDAENKLIQFAPTLRAYMKLLYPMITKGIKLLLRYPRLIPLFAAAVLDNVKDLTR
jgi:hypothetical protein